MRAQQDAKRVKWVPAVGSLVFLSRQAFHWEPTKMDLAFVGPVEVTKVLGKQATVEWLGEPRLVSFQHLRPCHLERTPETLTMLHNLWAQWRSPDPTLGKVEHGVWHSAEVPDDEDEELDVRLDSELRSEERVDSAKRETLKSEVRLDSTKREPSAPQGIETEPAIQNKSSMECTKKLEPPLRSVKPPTSGLFAVRDITKSKVEKNGRRIFKGRYAHPEKGKWYWKDLCWWEPQHKSWCVTEQVYDYFRSAFPAYKNLKNDKMGELLDFGALPGFLLEAKFSRPFWEGIKAQWEIVWRDSRFERRFGHLKDEWIAALGANPPA